ncbi:unnamed protein product [Rangifer tarandus platyrhynchus]|uniref:Uncharacterized protein n=2 Tax=Rangifer tarandus platyrhynchus TaxID=3082113 RepID=A0ACB0FL33_RANTA|nr:unnamed protein product [Rangifer tarandus platyrhynchus]CAI9713379.1 unnamed protein product [Rangifer tarandus platyrhynchus]
MGRLADIMWIPVSSSFSSGPVRLGRIHSSEDHPSCYRILTLSGPRAAERRAPLAHVLTRPAREQLQSPGLGGGGGRDHRSPRPPHSPLLTAPLHGGEGPASRAFQS